LSAKETLLQYFQEGTLCGKTFTEIAKFLKISHREKKSLLALLDSLCEDGTLYVTGGGKYGTPDSLGLIKGTLSGNERGFAFLIPEERTVYEKDFFIPHKNLNGAMHGDTVYAERVYGRSDDEAEVVKILSRGYTEIVGTFRKDSRAGYLIPDEKKYFENIYIPLSRCFNIPDGVKAVAKITEYPYGKAPGGEIIEILGEGDDFFAEELSIIRSYKLREEFPPGVEREAERQAARKISAEDLADRKDLRDALIVTIDGEDTRDIDDAVSLERLGTEYLLGVHIADVSHYVKYRSPLDKEAFSRGTSVYFPDRVLPMLPRALSNGSCSLNEGEDRLTLSCIMRVDKKGAVKDSEIVKSVIRSAHRMTYTEVTQILNGDEETCKKYADVKDMIFLFAELTNILKTMREKRGSIELDVKEAKIMLDDDGNIVIPDYERSLSHEIIEQFMVLANETVAEYMHSIEMPFVYRIHEKPAEEKAAMFREFAQNLGLRAKFSADEVKSYDYQKLLKSAEDLPVFPVLNRVMLRSMQKARYSPVNVGHFGLASPCYCHFTSPIRRYPDLCIHRIIKEVLDGKYAEGMETYNGFVSEAAIQSSECERRAAEAEREVDALYATMYMSERLGEEYDAVISGVTAFGLFAELPNTIEGFIPLETLEGSFEFIPERFLLKGSTESYSIGEELRIRVEDVDFFQRRTRFSLIEKIRKGEQE
jgi:ribonuclease R